MNPVRRIKRRSSGHGMTPNYSLLDIGENRIFNKKKTLCHRPIGVRQESGFKERLLNPVSAQSGSESSLSVLIFQA